MPREFWLCVAGLFGLFVGSFLNVAIHRLPQEGMSVSRPRRSLCPKCRKTLTWSENVPLLSWLVQRGRCRGCRWPIPWRYPLVEALTAAAWVWLAWVTPAGQWGLLAVYLVTVSGLIVATFVDFAYFEIPDEISIGGMCLAPLACLAVPALHEADWVALAFSPPSGVSRFGSLVGGLAGMAAGGGVLLGIGWLGKRIWGRDAMGLGDVKLLCGAGGLLGLWGVVLALTLASLVASVAGLGNVGRFLCLSRCRARARGSRKPFAKSLATARVAGRYLPFGPYLALGIMLALVYWESFARRL
jgi:leader peptidase (prepilin peptidase)/N-methyltransferase